jgi:hypothetical protein
MTTNNSPDADGNVTITNGSGELILTNHGDTIFIRDGWTVGFEKHVYEYFTGEKRKEAFQYPESIAATDLVKTEVPIPKKPEYVNIMLMDEMHKIDKDKLWASIRAFGDGGIG